MAGVELRAAPDGKGPGTLVGYAAVFGPLSEDLGGFIERVEPGAFAEALATCDVRALFNHDENHLVGRTKSSTLRLYEDQIGLHCEIDLPDTQLGRDIAMQVKRGDIDGMSFTFIAAVDTWDYSGRVPVRTISKMASIYDVGPVTWPAYTDTTVALRSLSVHTPPAETPAEPKPTTTVVPTVPSSVYQARIRIALMAVPPVPTSPV